jgi:hypothetical protein
MNNTKADRSKQSIVEGGFVKKGGVNTGSSANRPAITPPAQKPQASSGKK